MGRFSLLFFLFSTACSGGTFEVAEVQDSSTTADEGVADSAAPLDAVVPDGVVGADGGEIDSGGTDSSLPEAMLPGCADNTMCGEGQWCKRDSCEAMLGTCSALPPVTGAFDPVCGCDKITYWNAAFAHSLGVTTHDGVCKAGARKGCGSGCQYCAHEALSMTGCTSAVLGDYCVRAPGLAKCVGGGDGVANCDGACRSLCQTILSGADYYTKTCTP